ncbi:MAG: HAD-IB family hydrolase [Pseudomonadota bacterium]
MSQQKKVVVVFDLDETITTIDTFPFLLIRVLAKRPSRWLKALHLPFLYGLYLMGRYDNTKLKQKATETILGGLEASEVSEIASWIVDALVKSHLRPRAAWVLEAHRSAGHHTILATASFDFYVGDLAKRLGFETVLCTPLIWRNGRVGSQNGLENCYGSEKARRVRQWLDQSLENAHIIAYSDSSADVPLFELADVAVAVNGSKNLKRLGIAHGSQDWQDVDKAQEDFDEVLQQSM